MVIIIFVIMLFKERVNSFIKEKKLLTTDDKVLVALSGGADSVALLRVLLSLGYTCEAAHCNFHLRGEESNRDEQFVRSLCESLHVRLSVADFNTAQYATEHHLSIEMAAREQRYQWFDSLRQAEGYSAIAVAHHRNDSVETFLLNLIRGTGINGLRGIPVRNGSIIRPLLNVSREDILDYLQSLGQTYVTDSTNLQDEFMRNKIRLNILPMMKEMNPSVFESISETANYLSATADVYNKSIQESRKRVLIQDDHDQKIINIPSLMAETSPTAVLFEILYPLGFNSAQISAIYSQLEGQSGKVFSNVRWTVLHNREQLQITLNEKIQSSVPQLDMFFAWKDEHFKVVPNPNIAYLDAEHIQIPITVRKWERGDKFVPFGMTGTKNISDYLTDRKYSLFEKENQYVACSGDQIIWVIGERIDNRFRITDKTQRILILQKKSN